MRLAACAADARARVQGGAPRARALAPSTVKAILLTTGQVFAQAVDDRLIVRSPFAKIKIPADRNHEEMHFLTAEQVNALAGGDRRSLPRRDLPQRLRRPARRRALGPPGRTGERARRHRRRRRVDERGRRLHAGPTKTGKRRTIAVPRFLAQMLGEHIGRYPSPDGWVFTALEGGPIHHHNFRHRHYVRATRGRRSLPGRSIPRPAPHLRGAAHRRGRHLEEVKTTSGTRRSASRATGTGTSSPKRARRWPTRSTTTYRERSRGLTVGLRRNRDARRNAHQRPRKDR